MHVCMYGRYAERMLPLEPHGVVYAVSQQRDPVTVSSFKLLYHSIPVRVFVPVSLGPSSLIRMWESGQYSFK